MNNPNYQFDTVIFGAGIVGLWTLARLRAAGYQAILFENKAIGGVQSIASQGIIHGGTKYALTGKLTGSAQAIGAMPAIWKSCLEGKGEVDLRATKVLADSQYLWTNNSLASGMAGFFASKIMQSRMNLVDSNELPNPFDKPSFKGRLYQLQEPVLDTASLAENFTAHYAEHIYLTPNEVSFEKKGTTWNISVEGLQLNTKKIILTAGESNQDLLNQLQQTQPEMQRRPLHMLMLKAKLPMLQAHCLGAGATPRLTITTNQLNDEVVWYLGGQVAEEGTKRSRDEQIIAGKQELKNHMPWMDLSTAKWSSMFIDRAELAMPKQKRPDDVAVISHNGITTCWPTKLAFAPRVAQKVLDGFEVTPSRGEASALPLPTPPLAQQPWQKNLVWS